MFLGFPALQLFTPPSCQATNCCKATLPSWQASNLHLLLSHAAKLSNCNGCRARPSSNQAVWLPSCQAVQQPSCNCCTSKLSNCQTDTVVRTGPPCRPFLVTMHPRCNIDKNVGPILGRSRPRPRPIQTTTSSVLKLVIVWFPSFLQAVGSQSIRFGTHVNRYQECFKSSWIQVWTL